MSQWGNNDTSSNSVLWAPVLVQKPANSVNRDAMYGNVTNGAFIPNQIVGVFGVSPAEVQAAGGGYITIARVEAGGTGYVNGALVDFTNAPGDVGAGANVSLTTNTTGGITSLTLANGGSTPYKHAPTGVPMTRISTTVTIANGGGAVLGSNVGTLTQNTTSVIATASTTSGLVNSEWIAVFSNSSSFTLEQINVVTNSTSFTLRSNGAFANTTGATFAPVTGNYDSTQNNQLVFIGGGHLGANSSTPPTAVFANNGNGAITSVTVSAQGNNYVTAPTITFANALNGSGANLVATLVGSGANLDFVISKANTGGADGLTAGWVVRREGTGGRAGRVTYETLVAMRGITGDGSDDNILPDA